MANQHTSPATFGINEEANNELSRMAADIAQTITPSDDPAFCAVAENYIMACLQIAYRAGRAEATERSAETYRAVTAAIADMPSLPNRAPGEITGLSFAQALEHFKQGWAGIGRPVWATGDSYLFINDEDRAANDWEVLR